MTKYNPDRRDQAGNFIDHDWTSISDIGKIFNDEVFTVEDYLRAEQAYVDTVKSLLLAASIRSMRIVDLEIRSIRANLYAKIDDKVTEKIRYIKEGKILSSDEIENVFRGCLREYMWCKLLGYGGCYIHFGYDYYVYVGFPSSFELPVLSKGVFLERINSPYLEDED